MRKPLRPGYVQGSCQDLLSRKPRSGSDGSSSVWTAHNWMGITVRYMCRPAWLVCLALVAMLVTRAATPQAAAAMTVAVVMARSVSFRTVSYKELTPAVLHDENIP
jgi:hypothetical protein